MCVCDCLIVRIDVYVQRNREHTCKIIVRGILSAFNVHDREKKKKKNILNNKFQIGVITKKWNKWLIIDLVIKNTFNFHTVTTRTCVNS